MAPRPWLRGKERGEAVARVYTVFENIVKDEKAVASSRLTLRLRNTEIRVLRAARARFYGIFVSNTRKAGWSVFGARAFGSEGSTLADTRASRVSG